MTYKDRLEMAFRNLWRRKSRTILTIISVMIGSTSIIIMISLGLGIKNSQMEMIQSFANLTSIQIISDGPEKPIDMSKLERIKKINHVETVIPSRDFYGEIALKSNKDYVFSTQTSVIPDEVFEKLTDEMIEEGKAPTKADKNAFMIGSEVRLNKMVRTSDGYTSEDLNDPSVKVVGGDYVFTLGYDEMGGEKSPFDDDQAGSKPTVAKVDLKACGKLSSKSFLPGRGIYMNETTFRTLQDEDEKLESPVLTNELFFSNDPNEKPKKYDKTIKYTNLSVVCDKYENVEEVEGKLKDMGYQTQSSTSMIDDINKNMSSVMTALAAIGSVAFVVAAIGIINTMLMSIYERKKEIGIMKVIGASVKDIKDMFLIESGFIGLFGGGVGLGLSYVISNFINKIAVSEMEGADFISSISIIPFRLALTGLVFSSLVGVLAGYIPAKRATNLSAIETLREG